MLQAYKFFLIFGCLNLHIMSVRTDVQYLSEIKVLERWKAFVFV